MPEPLPPASDPLPDPDALLMMRACEGDLAAFEEIVRHHQRPLLNFFARLGNRSEAEDLAQETFVRLYRYRNRYRPNARLTTFLYLLARQVRIDYLRKHIRRENLHQKVGEETPQEVLPTATAQGARIDVATALTHLSEAMREVVVLSILQGLPHAEISAILGIPVGTVKSRLSIALHRLREIMEQ